MLRDYTITMKYDFVLLHNWDYILQLKVTAIKLRDLTLMPENRNWSHADGERVAFLQCKMAETLYWFTLPRSRPPFCSQFDFIGNTNALYVNKIPLRSVDIKLRTNEQTKPWRKRKSPTVLLVVKQRKRDTEREKYPSNHRTSKNNGKAMTFWEVGQLTSWDDCTRERSDNRESFSSTTFRSCCSSLPVFSPHIPSLSFTLDCSFCNNISWKNN